MLAQQLSVTVEELGAALAVVTGRAAVRGVIAALALSVVVLLGLWVRADRADRATLTRLQSTLAVSQSRQAALENSVTTNSANLTAQYQAAESALRSETSSFFGSTDQVAMVVALAGLADRIGVSYSGLRVGPVSTTTLAGMRYGLRSGSVRVQGGPNQVTRFITAIQSGMIPGASLERLALTENGSKTSANLAFQLYTVPSSRVRFTPPESLVSVGAADPGDSNPPEIAIGAVSTPVLTWVVKGRHAWTDALLSAHLQVAAPPNSIQAYELYAETTGDGNLEPGRDQLLATSAAASNGELKFELTRPFEFDAGPGQRFYLAATVSPAANPGALDISAPPGAMQFWSSAWPDAADATKLQAHVQVVRPPSAGDLNETVSAGVQSRISIPATLNQGLRVVVVAGPSHGTVSVGGGMLVYTPDSGFSGSDSLTYSITDGVLSSRVATVNLNVTRSGTASAPPKTGASIDTARAGSGG